MSGKQKQGNACKPPQRKKQLEKGTEDENEPKRKTQLDKGTKEDDEDKNRKEQEREAKRRKKEEEKKKRDAKQQQRKEQLVMLQRQHPNFSIVEESSDSDDEYQPTVLDESTSSESEAAPYVQTPSIIAENVDWQEEYRQLHVKYIALKEKVRILEQSSQTEYSNEERPPPGIYNSSDAQKYKEEIQNLVEGKDSENTRKATKNAVVTFLAYWNEVKPEDERKLNELLANFWPNAKKQNGDSYKKSALMGIRFGLQRHFLLKREFDILSGKVDHHSPISKEDLEKIQSSYNPSSPDPKSLLQVVWFDIIFHLIRRGRENLRLLTKESFAVQVDAAGKKFIKLLINWTKTTAQTINQMILQGKDLNPALSCLWQRPRATENFSHSDEVWYCNVPLGKNTLGTFMSSISKELKLSQKYTNHCIRATAVSLLDECNFEARHIMRVSGHKSESSIRSYSRRLSELKQKEISHALSSACSAENLESTSTQIMVEVSPGTGVFWYLGNKTSALNNTKTAGELTAYLMDTFFSKETMAMSNMNGGGKKGYQQLNPSIVNALRGFVLNDNNYGKQAGIIFNKTVQDKCCGACG
ncbi:hypothetical protein P5673_018764, partial [Acropora cervicornis]